jgi:hypothetical protein
MAQSQVGGSGNRPTLSGENPFDLLYDLPDGFNPRDFMKWQFSQFNQYKSQSSKKQVRKPPYTRPTRTPHSDDDEYPDPYSKYTGDEDPPFMFTQYRDVDRERQEMDMEFKDDLDDNPMSWATQTRRRKRPGRNAAQSSRRPIPEPKEPSQPADNSLNPNPNSQSVRNPNSQFVCLVTSTEFNLSKLPFKTLQTIIVDAIGEPKEVMITRNQKIRIVCTDNAQLNILRTIQKFGKHNIDKYFPEIRQPLHYVLVHGIDTDVSIDDVKSQLQPPPIVVYRGKRQGEDANFVKCGYKDQAPRKVKMGFITFNAIDVTNKPPICGKCKHIGHIQSNCTSTKNFCPKCAGDHAYDLCPHQGNKFYRCVNCAGQHSATYGGCPAIKTYAAVTAITKKRNCNRQQATRIYKQSNPTIPIPPPRSQLPTTPDPAPNTIEDEGVAYTKFNKEQLDNMFEEKVDKLLQSDSIVPKLLATSFAVTSLYNIGFESEQVKMYLPQIMQFVVGEEFTKLYFKKAWSMHHDLTCAFTGYCKEKGIAPGDTSDIEDEEVS